ncbi:MAG: universal stress protein [Candidatus Obscuribacterales bacterium]|nr:universal stress protein [Candidatus Obscuribacterales bacterium]
MKVLLAVEEQKLAEQSLRYVLEQHLADNSEILVLNVIKSVAAEALLGPLQDHFLEDMRKDKKFQAEKLVRHIALKLRDHFPGGLISERVVEGKVAETIEEIARSEGFDLVILASHERQGLEKIICGSVSCEITAHPPCSVLVLQASKLKAHASTSSKHSLS